MVQLKSDDAVKMQYNDDLKQIKMQQNEMYSGQIEREWEIGQLQSDDDAKMQYDDDVKWVKMKQNEICSELKKMYKIENLPKSTK